MSLTLILSCFLHCQVKLSGVVDTVKSDLELSVTPLIQPNRNPHNTEQFQNQMASLTLF
jgi:hypothetical protein